MVNNAGILNKVGPTDWLTVDDYLRHCSVNLFGLIDVTTTFLPLVKKTQGRIVNVSSDFGLMANPAFAAYSVSKFGIEAFSDALRYDVLPQCCRCECIVAFSKFQAGFWLINGLYIICLV